MRSIALIVCFFFVCTGCTKSDSKSKTPPLSSLSVENVSQVRSGTSTTTFRFVIDVNPVNTKDISLDYTTKDGTAISGKDYTAVSGTLTIAANQYSGYIDVIVTADSLRQNDQIFTLELSSPVNATLSATQVTGTIQNTGTYMPIDNAGYTSASSYSGMTLAWSDEFNGKTLITASWTYET